MIKFVYFDVGGVVIKDFSSTNKWTVLKKEIGITAESDQKFENLYDKYTSQINTTLHINDFYKIVRKEFNLEPISSYDFLIDGFIKRFSKNETLWPVIEVIKKDCKIGLLTNMWVDMLDQINKFGLLSKINWDVIVDSTKILLEKPDPKIFDLSTRLSGVKKSEILFVDNSQKNIDAAKKFGWQTFFYDSADYPKSSKELVKFYLERK